MLIALPHCMLSASLIWQVLEGEWLTTKGTPRGAGWVGKMRERSNSGWRAAATAGAPASANQPRQDRGQIDRGA